MIYRPSHKTMGEIDTEIKMVISDDDSALYYTPINSGDRAEL